jgi:hypothetical protein
LRAPFFERTPYVFSDKIFVLDNEDMPSVEQFGTVRHRPLPPRSLDTLKIAFDTEV